MNQNEWQLLKSKLQSSSRGWPTFVLILVDTAIFVESAYLRFHGGSIGGVISILLLSLVLLHAYLLLHEATHSAISKNKVLNDLVGHLCGWLIVMPYLTRQRSHLLHHMWTGHPTGDPANQRVIKRFSVLTELQAQKLERIWSSWLPLLTLNDRIGMWRDPFLQRDANKKSKRFEKEIYYAKVYRVGYLILFAALLATGSFVKFIAWYFPAVIIQLALEELTNLPHHAETPLLDESEKAPPYWEQHKLTHSCKSIPIWSRFILLNFNLHTAHHFFPWVAWHGLREAHREVAKKIPDLENHQSTHSELRWSLTNRRRPLLEIMGHYFNKIPQSGDQPESLISDLALTTTSSKS